MGTYTYLGCFNGSKCPRKIGINVCNVNIILNVHIHVNVPHIQVPAWTTYMYTLNVIVRSTWYWARNSQPKFKQLLNIAEWVGTR